MRYLNGMTMRRYDLCIIGGGINGAGVARDAAMRGLSVILLEQGDLASATSSASTKLVHGGLRYLEFYEFALVRESLKERERLLGIAPHIIWPMDFVLPHHAGVRPLWMIRAGLFLYDSLGGRKTLKSSKYLPLSRHDYGTPLKENYKKGFSYADCWVQDARLVVLNAMDAQARGAEILTRHKVVGLENAADHWCVKYESEGEQTTIQADMIVNAAGPWVQKLLQKNGFYEADKDLPHLKLVKGSHIIVPEQFEGDQAYILQQNDGRIVFAIPYEDRFTLIGTTDEPVAADAQNAQISDAEIAYLCKAYNGFFDKQIAPQDVVQTYSGVRALLDDGRDEARTVTRDYLLYHHDVYVAPMISVFGGKITTYRKLSEQLVDMLLDLTNRKIVCETDKYPLPGGDIEGRDMDAFYNNLLRQYPWAPEKMLRRFAVHYGTLSHDILQSADALNDLGVHFGNGVYEAEIRYLCDHEFARSSEDILWRRTKLSLHISPATKANIEQYLKEKSHG